MASDGSGIFVLLSLLCNCRLSVNRFFIAAKQCTSLCLGQVDVDRHICLLGLRLVCRMWRQMVVLVVELHQKKEVCQTVCLHIFCIGWRLPEEVPIFGAPFCNVRVLAPLCCCSVLPVHSFEQNWWSSSVCSITWSRITIWRIFLQAAFCYDLTNISDSVRHDQILKENNHHLLSSRSIRQSPSG